jgi:hypothetical protein
MARAMAMAAAIAALRAMALANVVAAAVTKMTAATIEARVTRAAMAAVKAMVLVMTAATAWAMVMAMAAVLLVSMVAAAVLATQQQSRQRQQKQHDKNLTTKMTTNMTTNMTTKTTTNVTTNTEEEGQGNGPVFFCKKLPNRIIVVAVVDAPLLLSSLVSQCAVRVDTGVDQPWENGSMQHIVIACPRKGILLCPELITIVLLIFVSGFDVNSFLLRVVLIPKLG